MISRRSFAPERYHKTAVLNKTLKLRSEAFQTKRRSRSTMRDTSITSNKVSASKAGSTMRARSPIASSPKLLLPPATSLPILFSTSAVHRRSVSFSCDSLDIMSGESVESIEQVGKSCFIFSHLQENSACIRLQPRSLPGFVTTPRTQSPSPLKISNANIATKSNNVREASARFTKEIRLNIKPKELDASSVRKLGLQPCLTQNTELPFLPEVGGECRENARTMCLTPISSQSLAQFSSPPVLQQTEEFNLHAASLAMPCRLFVPDDF
jgi:hypothetical protein